MVLKPQNRHSSSIPECALPSTSSLVSRLSLDFQSLSVLGHQRVNMGGCFIYPLSIHCFEDGRLSRQSPGLKAKRATVPNCSPLLFMEPSARIEPVTIVKNDNRSSPPEVCRPYYISFSSKNIFSR